ncbi:hypothetical protein IQE94_08985 [Synechocystis sp. PCC 7339]|uniref:hypothetical protein n=1 Tax=unclassified Synechocystis TaxID=2640012 RepID=UPI001BAE7CE1|nr:MULTISPECIES: hypothetical protein [unclassified Synechocystis]QUS62144.1 hypothetical protein HTZ78_16750 [Synechocystis sp. PCC 7338]UAJ71327.1 hypothetical protein IQE94_08985 [Synechocystis sp. PCC 7339]
MGKVISKSFLNGMARTLDMSGICLVRSPIRQKYISASGHLRSSHLLSQRPDLMDSHSIRSDFEAIGNDLKMTIYQYQKDQQTI